MRPLLFFSKDCLRQSLVKNSSPYLPRKTHFAGQGRISDTGYQNFLSLRASQLTGVANRSLR